MADSVYSSESDDEIGHVNNKNKNNDEITDSPNA